MVRPKKTELESRLREKGLTSFDLDSLREFHDRKFHELQRLHQELGNKLETARNLVKLLEELRRLLCDNNMWTVIKKTLEDPGAITAEVTRGYGMDHREALSKTAWLVNEGYIERSDLELDPVRDRYVRYQYPGSRLLKLLQNLSQAINEYTRTYEEIKQLKRNIRDTIEAIKLAKKYMKYYLKH